jgi:hypothetical protein
VIILRLPKLIRDSPRSGLVWYVCPVCGTKASIRIGVTDFPIVGECHATPIAICNGDCEGCRLRVDCLISRVSELNVLFPG